MKSVYIVPTGEEIREGVVLDLDSVEIMSQLLRFNPGVNVTRISPLPDDETRIFQAVQELAERGPSLIVLIGGSGGGHRHSKSLGKDYTHSALDVSYNRYLKNTDCVFCGQCVTHCPTGALTVRDDTTKVLRALADPEITTIIQVAPAVRVAWAEVFNLPSKQATTGRMVAALKRIGFDYVFDTNFAADLTIMEEGSEFIDRFLYPPEVDLVDNVLTGKRTQSLFFQPLKGNFVGGGVDFPIDLIAPGQGLSVQVRQTVVLDPHHKIISDKLHRPLHFSFRLTPIWPAQDGFEPIESREVLKLPV